MKTKKIFNFLLLLGFLSGCDYLDIVPDNLPTLEMAFNNKSSAERFLFTCYSFVPEHGKIGTDPGMDVGDEVWYYSDNSADYSNKTTFWIAKGMQNSNEPLVDYWNGAQWGKAMFVGIRDCNVFIENIDKVPDLSAYDKETWKAEAKVLKAFYHFWMMRMYGPIPIIKENIRHEWVNGDQVHLMQIFSNLLSNAIKYTQEGGEIQLLAEECESNSSVYAKYRFLVCDNGVGMSADFKDRIFDAFTRAENSLTNKIQGTGLGMAITKNLIDSMGGTIDVESEPGQGSCFEVFMDLKIAEERSASPASQAEPKISPSLPF